MRQSGSPSNFELLLLEHGSADHTAKSLVWRLGLSADRFGDFLVRGDFFFLIVRMNGNPGVTLFNDGGSIQVNNTSALHRAEEEEALADHQRRQKELAKEMVDAFDDLIEEGDQNDTLNSLDYSSHHSEHSPPPTPLPKGERYVERFRFVVRGKSKGYDPHRV